MGMGSSGQLPAKGTLALDSCSQMEPGTFLSPSDPPRVHAIALAICSQMEKVSLEAGEPLGHGATSQQGRKRTPPPEKGSSKGGELDLVLPPQRGAGLDPAEHPAPFPRPRSPAPPSEEPWGFLHAVSRLRRCVNWIRWEAERDADLEELLSGARLLPV